MHRVLRAQQFSVLSLGSPRLSALHDVTVELPLDVPGAHDAVDGGERAGDDGEDDGEDGGDGHDARESAPAADEGGVDSDDSDDADVTATAGAINFDENLRRGRFAGATANIEWAPLAVKGDLNAALAVIEASKADGAGADRRHGASGDGDDDRGDDAVLTPAKAHQLVTQWKRQGLAGARARAAAAAHVYSCSAVRRVLQLVRLVFSSIRVRVLSVATVSALVGLAVLSTASLSESSSVVGDIVSRERSVFKALLTLLLVSIGSAAADSLNDLMQGRGDADNGSLFTGGLLGLSCRDALQRSLHAHYFANQAYYRVSLLRDEATGGAAAGLGRRKIDNAAQRIVEDATSFLFDSMLFVINGILNPLIQIVTVVVGLTGENTGAAVAILAPLIAAQIVAAVLVNPQWTRLVYAETVCEGDFRRAHVALRESAENVSLHGGLGQQALRVGAHMQATLQAQWDVNFYNFWTNRLMALMWKFGFNVAIVALPYLLFFYRWEWLGALGLRDANAGPIAHLTGSEADKFRTFALVHGAASLVTDTVVTLMGSINTLPNVVAAGNRVGELLEWLVKFSREGEGEGEDGRDGPAAAALGRGADVDAEGDGDRRTVALQGVTVAAPGGRTLVRAVSFVVGPRADDVAAPAAGSGHAESRVWQSVLIEGPSGSGKTSLLRAVAGLWQPTAGRALRPRTIGAGGLFFLPQRPFMLPKVSLAQQVAYPHCRGCACAGRRR